MHVKTWHKKELNKNELNYAIILIYGITVPGNY